MSTLDVKGRSFSWLPDSQHVVVCSEPQYVLGKYNVLTGAVVHSYPGHTNWAWPYVDDTGRVLTSVGADSTVRTWDLLSARPKDEFSFRSDKNWAKAVGPKGRLLAMAFDRGGNIGIWDIRTKSVEHTLPKQRRVISVLVFTKDGKHLYVGSDGGKLTLHSINSGQEIGQFTGHSGWVTALTISPDEKQIVSSDRAGRTIVWDVESTQPLFTLLSDTDTHVVSLDWNGDNRRIVAGKDDGTVQIWTLPTGP